MKLYVVIYIRCHGPLVKRLRLRPLTAATRVRFPYGSSDKYNPSFSLGKFGFFVLQEIKLKRCSMNIRIAEETDIETIASYDTHINRNELTNLIRLGRVYAAEENGVFVGWLRYNMFWDNTPFMNMLFVLDGFRGRGAGKALMENWERIMREAGFGCVMTSSQQDEYAQHFYIKQGYSAIGGFLPCGGEPYEIIFSKPL